MCQGSRLYILYYYIIHPLEKEDYEAVVGVTAAGVAAVAAAAGYGLDFKNDGGGTPAALVEEDGGAPLGPVVFG